MPTVKLESGKKVYIPTEAEVRGPNGQQFLQAYMQKLASMPKSVVPQFEAVIQKAKDEEWLDNAMNQNGRAGD